MEMAVEVESSYLYFRLYPTHLKIYFHLNLDVDLHPDIQEGFGFRVQGLEFEVRDRSVTRIVYTIDGQHAIDYIYFSR